MNSRERVLKTIAHKQPDRPPIFATLTPQIAKKLSEYLKLPYEAPLDSLLSTRISHMNLLTKLGNDCVGIAACSPDDMPTRLESDGTIINEWGMVFKESGLYNEFYSFPLAHADTAEDISSYPFPDPFAPGRFREAEKTVHTFKESHAIVADLECAIFETAWYLTGLEKLLMDLLLQPPYLNPLLDKIAGINTEIGKQLISLGADIIWCGDDFGSQQGMMMSPEIWREHFKPRMKKMFDQFRAVNPQIKIAWHTCGSILPIIPDLIEIGLDILNPLQPLASGMDPTFLKDTYGDKLVFFGGIDVQNLLPNGTPDRVREEVKRVATIYGKNGGYLAAPAHNIQADTPIENIMTMYDTLMNLTEIK